ncbi:ArsR/SmtB family transcription factor [Yinghuangia soli]|uniref:Helix-turn-helix domain-containing protein n=1 Tax=Yinghuangia soli TaxID=2908204 RepID=A0AA41Q5N0_9ACTN|nr:helix-turn-helix domain-containing protein [Yinghuangia soli]MCF2532023.1 helix-turn-helix domain-containing protein [Yinghuangia soli]
MLGIEFTVEDVARTRFALSPLWEVVASIRVLKGSDAEGMHRPWADEVRPRLAAAGADLAPLFDLVPVPTLTLPAFLGAPPTLSQPSLDVELAALRATPPERIDGSDGIPPARIDALRADPDRALGELADAVTAYWEIALAPYWPRILTLLEGDILYRARRLADGGAYRLFDDLDPGISWDDGTLRLAMRFCRGVRRLDGRGLLLNPSVFVWPRVFSLIGGPWQPTVRYPPRGIASLWTPTASAPSAALAAVLGRSRALLLGELAAPASTTDLARRTGLTPGGVSQHLTALRDARLVSAHRTGRTVLYARTRIAEALLAEQP